MPHGGEVLYCLANPMGVIDTNIADARRLRTNIDKDQRQIPETKMLQQFVFHAEGEYGDSIHSAFDHSSDRELHAFGIMNGRGEENFVVVLHRQGFERLHNLREKWIGYLGNDQAKD